MLITFEGGEGTGKSTQAKMLVKYLINEGVSAIYSREPGSSPLAERIRELIINEPMDQVTQFFLFQAARRDHVNNTIIPALREGIIVVCDRYIDSTMVYQDQVDNSLHKSCLSFGSNFTNPDLTFIMDMPVKTSIERLEERGNLNQFDEVDITVHEYRRKRFLEIAEQNIHRCVVIYADQEPDKVHRDILKYISLKFI